MRSSAIAAAMRSGWPSAATPGSVTSSARRTPSRASSQPASAEEPGPNFTGVASSVKTCSRIAPPRVSRRMELRTALAEIVGERHVLADDDLRAPYERDWTGRFGGAARLVVRPADTGQVAAAVRACAQARAGIVPQGGNTGLVGGGVPRGGEVVLSLRRLDAIGEVDSALGQVTAGAGATLAALQSACARAGQDAGLDFGARDSCTIGGVVACDAGGARALRHGTARARVAGLEAVLADGSVVSRLGGLTKDNAGYDLPALLVGSEGTLGIVTQIRWRLVPLLSSRVAALVPMSSARDAAALLPTLRECAPSLESCDFFFDDGLQLVRRPP